MARIRRFLVLATVTMTMTLTMTAATIGIGPAGTARAASATDAVNSAVAYGSANSVTEFISVVDRGSGAVLAQTGNADTQVASESIMKLFLAAYYLTSIYPGYLNTPDAVKNRLSYMLRVSDDGTATALFSPNAIPTVAGRYGLTNTSNATDSVGHWGAARITARDVTRFLYGAFGDPLVGPWLSVVMSQTEPRGSDGFDQHFGLNALNGVHGSKQGWGCDSYFTSPTCAIHSVGYTDRTFVAVLQLAASYPDPMRNTATYAAQVIQQATAKPDPIGSVDAVTNPALNVLRVGGWAADPAAPGQRTEVHIYVTGPSGRAGYAGTFTGAARPDVAGVVPWAGGATGYQASVPAQGAGLNQVCVYALNVQPPNTNPQIGCKSVQVRDAFGYLDAVGSATGQLIAGGWAANPNNPTEKVQIHVYDTGPSGTRRYPGFIAGSSRPDVGAALPGYGMAHGYSAAIPSTETGAHTVCSFAITTAGGSGNPLLGCKNVQVRNAFGSFDLVSASGNTISAAGWALNPNNRAEHVEIHVYDTSASGTRRYPGFIGRELRPDVAAAYPGYGPDRGFWATIPAVDSGRHTVCAFAITTGGGAGNPLLGCRDVVVR